MPRAERVQQLILPIALLAGVFGTRVPSASVADRWLDRAESKRGHRHLGDGRHDSFSVGVQCFSNIATYNDAGPVGLKRSDDPLDSC